MNNRWAVKTAIVAILSVLIFRCGDEGETKHFKYIANAEWSPTETNSLLISKDEFDGKSIPRARHY
ncbi:MAG: hypothetical protein HYR76_04495 [Ignavibacteria bacterium]|nr:hypothetical protein [Ignavibacteria bacterium]